MTENKPTVKKAEALTAWKGMPENSQILPHKLESVMAQRDELERKLAQAEAARDELLAAAKLALDKLTGLQEHFGHKWPLDLSPRRAETDLKAAIARAEGRVE